MLNILFASSPENVYDLPCTWNIKKENCVTKNVSLKTDLKALLEFEFHVEKTLQSVIKGRDERRSGKENSLKRDASIDVTRLIFSNTL